MRLGGTFLSVCMCLCSKGGGTTNPCAPSKSDLIELLNLKWIKESISLNFIYSIIKLSLRGCLKEIFYKHLFASLNFSVSFIIFR